MRIAGNVLGNVARPNFNNAVVRNNKPDIMGTGKAEKQERKDKAIFSPMGKATSLIEDLMKKKQDIIESKNEYVKDSIEKGLDFNQMKGRLKMYEEQLKDVEKELLEAAKQTVEEEDSTKTEKAKTGEEDAEKIQQFLKERGFQPVNKSSFEGIVNTATKMELATKQRGVKQRADVKLATASRSEFTTPEELAKLQEGADRSGKIMAMATKEANKTALAATKNGDGLTSPIEATKDSSRPTASAKREGSEQMLRDAPYVQLGAKELEARPVDDGQPKAKRVSVEE